MDFVTHSLVGATTARLFARRPEELPALALTGVLASLIMDRDSWLAMLGPAAYGRWHRVASHSLVGLIVCAGLALAFVFAVQVIPRARRFGWFVSPKLGVETVPVFPAALKLIAVAALAAALHWLGDVITGFGNMKLFWPWSDCDFSLSAVTSFDWFLARGRAGVRFDATVAQLAEQGFCKAQVVGSSPSGGSSFPPPPRRAPRRGRLATGPTPHAARRRPPTDRRPDAPAG